MKLRYLIIFILLTACGSLSEAGKALRNEKVLTTDEFLIEKRGPLSIPPDALELPKPKNKNNNESESVKKNPEQDSDINKNKSSLEKLILEEIKNN
tara:strand:+ start:511 stop:798 length:288 start_codon:yes stop_codon:yes gene_type:complete